MMTRLAHRSGMVLTIAALVTCALTVSLTAQTAPQPGALAEVSTSRFGQRDIGLRGHGFVRDANGVFTTIDAPEAALETVLFGINNRGQIVGGYIDEAGTRVSFVLDDGDFDTFALPGASRTAAFDIDERGRIVGFYMDGIGPGHGFLLDRGEFTTIDIPDESGPRPPQVLDINNRGQMVGLFIDAQGILTAFLRDRKGVVTEIARPDATPPSGAPSPFGTIPLGVNKQGQIVGAFR